MGVCEEQISIEFVQLYDKRNDQEDFPHGISLFSRELIPTKIQDLRNKYHEGVDNGKCSGDGRTVACFYGISNEIWGGYPSTTGIGHGLDTADFGVSVVTTANTEPVLWKSTTTKYMFYRTNLVRRSQPYQDSPQAVQLPL